MTESRILASVFTCCPPGQSGFTGGESLLGWNLINQLARFHDVWALTQEADRVTIENTFDEYYSQNIHFQYVGLPSFFNPLLHLQGGHQIYYYLWQIRAYFIARKLQKQHHFDLFHHITYANDWMASFIGALLPVSYIRGPGGGAQRTPKKFLSQYNLKGRVWERLRTWGQWIFRHDPFFTISQRRADAILVCNPESMNALPKGWRSKASLFPVNGVSQSDLSINLSERQDGNIFRILTAGKLIRIKGFDLGIEAYSIFAKKNPDSELIIVGDGPDSKYLQESARRSGVADKIKFEAWMPREDLLKLMASSDVFLFPGLRDGGGEVVVEAMSMGSPVICFDIGGPALHVTEDTGIKVTPAAPRQGVREMAIALERIYMDKDLRNSMGDAARARAEQVYDWDRAGERLLEIYQKVIFAKNRIDR